MSVGMSIAADAPESASKSPSRIEPVTMKRVPVVSTATLLHTADVAKLATPLPLTSATPSSVRSSKEAAGLSGSSVPHRRSSEDHTGSTTTSSSNDISHDIRRMDPLGSHDAQPNTDLDLDSDLDLDWPGTGDASGSSSSGGGRGGGGVVMSRLTSFDLISVPDLHTPGGAVRVALPRALLRKAEDGPIGSSIFGEPLSSPTDTESSTIASTVDEGSFSTLMSGTALVLAEAPGNNTAALTRTRRGSRAAPNAAHASGHAVRDSGNPLDPIKTSDPGVRPARGESAPSPGAVRRRCSIDGVEDVSQLMAFVMPVDDNSDSETRPARDGYGVVGASTTGTTIQSIGDVSATTHAFYSPGAPSPLAAHHSGHLSSTMPSTATTMRTPDDHVAFPSDLSKTLLAEVAAAAATTATAAATTVKPKASNTQQSNANGPCSPLFLASQSSVVTSTAADWDRQCGACSPVFASPPRPPLRDWRSSPPMPPQPLPVFKPISPSTSATTSATVHGRLAASPAAGASGTGLSGDSTSNDISVRSFASTLRDLVASAPTDLHRFANTTSPSGRAYVRSPASATPVRLGSADLPTATAATARAKGVTRSGGPAVVAKGGWTDSADCPASVQAMVGNGTATTALALADDDNNNSNSGDEATDAQVDFDVKPLTTEAWDVICASTMPACGGSVGAQSVAGMFESMLESTSGSGQSTTAWRSVVDPTETAASTPARSSVVPGSGLPPSPLPRTLPGSRAHVGSNNNNNINGYSQPRRFSPCLEADAHSFEQVLSSSRRAFARPQLGTLMSAPVGAAHTAPASLMHSRNASHDGLVAPAVARVPATAALKSSATAATPSEPVPRVPSPRAVPVATKTAAAAGATDLNAHGVCSVLPSTANAGVVPLVSLPPSPAPSALPVTALRRSPNPPGHGGSAQHLAAVGLSSERRTTSPLSDDRDDADSTTPFGWCVGSRSTGLQTPGGDDSGFSSPNSLHHSRVSSATMFGALPVFGAATTAAASTPRTTAWSPSPGSGRSTVVPSPVLTSHNAPVSVKVTVSPGEHADSGPLLMNHMHGSFLCAVESGVGGHTESAPVLHRRTTSRLLTPQISPLRLRQNSLSASAVSDEGAVLAVYSQSLTSGAVQPYNGDDIRCGGGGGGGHWKGLTSDARFFARRRSSRKLSHDEIDLLSSVNSIGDGASGDACFGMLSPPNALRRGSHTGGSLTGSTAWRGPAGRRSLVSVEDTITGTAGVDGAAESTGAPLLQPRASRATDVTFIGEASEVQPHNLEGSLVPSRRGSFRGSFVGGGVSAASSLLLTSSFCSDASGHHDLTERA